MDQRPELVEVTADDLATVTTQRLTTAKLTHLDRRLTRYAPGTEPDDLVAIRSDLVAQAATYHLFQPAIVSDKVADHSRLSIPDWLTIRVPVLTQGIQETPATSGAIETWGLGHGWVAVQGEPANNGSGEEFWVSNWSTTVAFPPAPVTGLLAYRFTVRGELIPYLASAVSGGLWATITVGVSGDAGTAIDWSTPAGSYWPVDEPLPLTPQGRTRLAGDVNITGQIPVIQGRRAVLGMIFVDIVRIASGRVPLIPTAAGFTVYHSGSMGPQTAGRIEYRFLPDWWLKAFDDIVTLNDKLLP